MRAPAALVLLFGLAAGVAAQPRGPGSSPTWPPGWAPFTLPADAKAVIFVIRPTADESPTDAGRDLRQSLTETRARLETNGLTVRETSDPGLLSFYFVASEGPPLGGFDIPADFTGVVLCARGKKGASARRGPERANELLLRAESYFGIPGLARSASR